MKTSPQQHHLLGEFPTAGTVSCHYGMFSRAGGISKGLFAACNIGTDLGDSREAVVENRRRVKEMMGVRSLVSTNQVHGTGILCVTEPSRGDVHGGEADGLITDLPGVGLMIQQADCQAVLLFDPVREVIAAVHCGWRGSVQGILGRTVALMQEKYGTAPPDLHGVISPSLGPCCAEFVNFRTELPEEFRDFMVRDNYFDFWQISKRQLVGAGMAAPRIRETGLCTCCSEQYFSYRRAGHQSGGVTGRQCSVICLHDG